MYHVLQGAEIQNKHTNENKYIFYYKNKIF